jgi:hypothetical protein
MPIPTHSLSCTTRAFKTNCPHCKETVFYFSCSCGSKVFFNELGYPWEKHDCEEYRYIKQVALIKNIDRLSTEEIYKIILQNDKANGKEMEQKVWDFIEYIIGKRKSKFTYTIVPPLTEYTEVSGIVMSFDKPINIFKRLGYDESNEFAIKLLGSIGKEKWAFAKIRTKPNRAYDCLEFEVLIPINKLKAKPIRLNDLIIGTAKPVKHAKGIFWELIKHEVY